MKFIAEIASTHNGSVARLKKLTNESIGTGADYIKFQIFKNKHLCHESSKFFKPLSKIEISYSDWEKHINYYKKKIKIILEPFDEESYYFCKKFKKDVLIKISSSESDNYGIIEDSINSFKKVFFNISGKAYTKIINYLKPFSSKKKKIVLLYGYQSFPTKFNFIRFGLINLLKKKYTVGYADHSFTKNDYLTYISTYLSIISGAEFIEKHITLKKKEKMPDYISSFEPSEFKEYIKFFKNDYKKMNNNNLTLDEKKYSYVMGKFAVLKSNVQKNHKISKDNLQFLRTGKIGLTRNYFFNKNKFKNIKAKSKLKKGTILSNTQLKLI